jgi:hypothetical protein
VIPLAPGPATLGSVNWDWLSGPTALFISLVASAITIWQFVLPGVRRLLTRHAAAPAVDVPTCPLAQIPAVQVVPAPRFTMRPDCRYSGGAVDPLAIMHLGYTDLTKSMPAPGTFPFGSVSISAGTASTT